MHSHFSSPSSWPPEIISRIASILAESTNDANTRNKCLSGMLYTCKSWSGAARRHISMHLYLDISSSPTCVSSQCPKAVSIIATIDQIASGIFAEKLKAQQPLLNTDSMSLKIESDKHAQQNSQEDANANFIPTEKIRKCAVGFAFSLIKIFPNIRTLLFHSSPDNSTIHSLYSTYVYSLLAGYANTQPHCSPKTIIGYHVYGNMLSIPHIPVVHAGLTHLSLGKIIWSEDGIVETVHRNASTLKVLSVAYARTTQALGLVVNAQEQPVIFPELVKLNLRIHSGVPMENREICSFNPFPKLQHLEIPGAFPFANGNLLNSKHLKTLVLGVSNHSLKTLRHTAVFSGKRNFEYVDIRMLPIEDPALFPMADFTESTGLSEINLTLCYNLVLSSVSSVPFFKVRIDLGLLLDVSNFISHIPENCNISELDLGSSVLSLNQATQLIAALPRLVHLKYTLPSIEDSTSDIPVIHHEKLEQITVTTAASAETCINDADYLAYMCFRVKSLLRLNVYAKESCREIISKQFWQKLVALDPFLEKVIPSHLSFASLLKFKREELPVDVNCVYTD